MKIRDPKILVAAMQARNLTQAGLGRYAGVSRQFIYGLREGTKNTCTPITASRIEEALGLDKGTLFVEPESRSKRQKSSSKRQIRGAAA